MRIGIDLDNTIISYDNAFIEAAVSRGLIPASFRGNKQQLRDTIRLRKDGEKEWQHLQGYVYGQGLAFATLFPGVGDFIKECRVRQDTQLFIVSHKTEYGHGDPKKINLRDAARQWLTEQKFFEPNGLGIATDHLYFTANRAEKLDAIRGLRLDCFIDDLVEVFMEPEFPAGPRKILFHAGLIPPPPGDWTVCRDWREIKDALLEEETPIKGKTGKYKEIVAVAERLAGAPVSSVHALGTGGNSRVYKIKAGSKFYALKQYPSLEKDPRDRLGTEKSALQWMTRHHITTVPVWISSDPPFALMEWVEGKPVTNPTGHDIDMAVEFIADIFQLEKKSPPDAMPMASEACLSGGEILRQLERRFTRLSELAAGEPALADFLHGAFIPALSERETAAQRIYTAYNQDFEAELLPEDRRLIPADFGFHNILRKSDRLMFFDFEYFGWDDPVKLVSDFLLHPAQPLPGSLKEHFFTGMMKACGNNPWTRKRFIALYPLFGLRWSLILLNEFLPERWQARNFAQGEAQNWNDVKALQLRKAQLVLLESATFL